MKLERKMANKLKNQGKLPCAKLMLSIITYCTAALCNQQFFLCEITALRHNNENVS